MWAFLIEPVCRIERCLSAGGGGGGGGGGLNIGNQSTGRPHSRKGVREPAHLTSPRLCATACCKSCNAVCDSPAEAVASADGNAEGRLRRAAPQTRPQRPGLRRKRWPGMWLGWASTADEISPRDLRGQEEGELGWDAAGARSRQCWRRAAVVHGRRVNPTR